MKIIPLNSSPCTLPTHRNRQVKSSLDRPIRIRPADGRNETGVSIGFGPALYFFRRKITFGAGSPVIVRVVFSLSFQAVVLLTKTAINHRCFLILSEAERADRSKQGNLSFSHIACLPTLIQ